MKNNRCGESLCPQGAVASGHFTIYELQTVGAVAHAPPCPSQGDEPGPGPRKRGVGQHMEVLEAPC